MEPSYFLQPNNQLEDFAQHWSSNQQQQLEPAQQTRGNELEDASADQWADFGGADSYFGGQGRTRSSLGTENPYELPPRQIEPSPMVTRMVFSGPAPTLASPSPIQADSAPQQTPQPVKTGAWDAEETSRLLQHASFTDSKCWDDIYPRLETTRTLENIKAQHYNYSLRFYHPDVTRWFEPTSSPTIIGPAPSPDWKPWHPTEHDTAVAMLKPQGKQDWNAIQRVLGTGRSVAEIQRHLGVGKGVRSAAKALATTTSSSKTSTSTSHRASSSPAPSLSSPPAKGSKASLAPKTNRHRSATPAAPPQSQQTSTAASTASQELMRPCSSTTALFDLLSTIADVLSTGESERSPVLEPKICRCCSKPIASKSGGSKRECEGEGEGHRVAKRMRGDQSNAEAGDEGDGYGGWV